MSHNYNAYIYKYTEKGVEKFLQEKKSKFYYMYVENT